MSKTSWKQSFKTINCKECGEAVNKVDSNAAWVVCWKCVAAQLSGIPTGIALEEWGKILEERKRLGPDCLDSN